MGEQDDIAIGMSSGHNIFFLGNRFMDMKVHSQSRLHVKPRPLLNDVRRGV